MRTNVSIYAFFQVFKDILSQILWIYIGPLSVTRRKKLKFL